MSALPIRAVNAVQPLAAEERRGVVVAVIGALLLLALVVLPTLIAPTRPRVEIGTACVVTTVTPEVCR
jgi:hypothetical protein